MSCGIVMETWHRGSVACACITCRLAPASEEAAAPSCRLHTAMRQPIMAKYVFLFRLPPLTAALLKYYLSKPGSIVILERRCACVLLWRNPFFVRRRAFHSRRRLVVLAHLINRIFNVYLKEAKHNQPDDDSTFHLRPVRRACR